MIPPQEKKRTRSRVGRPRKSALAETELFKLETLDSPFEEDELSTLEEYERISKTGPKQQAVSKRIERLDLPGADSGPKPSKSLPPRRPKKTRRRQIDPATCERDYNREELEFMNALSEYKRSSGRMFPTCSEILEVLKSLGYEKAADRTEEAEPESGMLAE